MRSTSLSPLALLCALVLTLMSLVACQPAEEAEAPAPAPAAEAAPVEAPSSTDRWEKDGLVVTALRDTPRFPEASLSLAGVEDGGRMASGAVAFDFSTEGFVLGEQSPGATENGLANSGQGQHIHLILNNGPYSAHYEPSFSKELEDGHYVMLAFLSRSWHESVKVPAAAVIRQFTVGEGDASAADLSAPHLFFSRPKGAYVGDDTNKLMLDFYLFNTTLSPEGNKVRATVNGSEFVFSEWVPYVIEGLPMGPVEITLELIDANGQLIPGPFNQVTRTTTLEAATEAVE